MKRKEELDRLHEMSVEELREQRDGLKESLFRLNFKLALGDVDSVKTLRRDKKSLARINTIISQREAAAATK
jgi:large subunit ribosomal protein L29